MNNPDFLVSIRCMTYNHALYIEDAMNGFCMQQTSFPFVAIIVDDASTDGEPEAIKSYLHKHFDMQNARQWETDDACFIEIRHKENQNCTFAVVLLKYNFWQAKKSKDPLIKEWMGSKYIAYCEGDDYWIDSNKLQKQITLLENNPDKGLLYTDFDNLIQTSQIYSRQLIGTGQYPQINSYEQHLFQRGYIAPMSWVYRLEYADIASLDKERPKTIEGSFVFALEMFLRDKVIYLDEVTCVHRILDESASHSKNPKKVYLYDKDVKSLQEYYSNKYPISTDAKEVLTDWFYRKHFVFIIKNNRMEEFYGLKSYYSKIQPSKYKQQLFSLFIKSKIGRQILLWRYHEKES